jgi:uncharacterized DUF497 family protein
MDDENVKHLAAHKITPFEFEQVMYNDPLDVDFDEIHGEDRYRSVGMTDGGRLLSIGWTLRKSKVRAVTAFPAGISDTGAFVKRYQ